jgi:hypothetical protein
MAVPCAPGPRTSRLELGTRSRSLQAASRARTIIDGVAAADPLWRRPTRDLPLSASAGSRLSEACSSGDVGAISDLLDSGHSVSAFIVSHD